MVRKSNADGCIVMEHLKTYIDSYNWWLQLQKEPLMTTHPRRLTPVDADKLFWSLETDMSPENLCCDGELSVAETNKKLKYFDTVVAELKALGFKPRSMPGCNVH